MPIDEIVFAVSCSATVTDEFEIAVDENGRQSTKLNDNVSKLIDHRRYWIEHSHIQSVRDEIDNTFSKIEWRDDKMGGKPIK